MSEHNQRQYLRMLNQLTRFEEGQIRIDALVDGLEGLFNALENVPESWKSAFLQQWGELEDERAYALFKNFRCSTMRQAGGCFLRQRN